MRMLWKDKIANEPLIIIAIQDLQKDDYTVQFVSL